MTCFSASEFPRVEDWRIYTSPQVGLIGQPTLHGATGEEKVYIALSLALSLLSSAKPGEALRA